MNERRSILLLCDDSRGHAGNVLQHVPALSESSRHAVYRFNPVDHPVANAGCTRARRWSAGNHLHYD